MTQAVSSCGGTGSDATLDNAHVAEDYLARTTAMYRIIAVGRTARSGSYSPKEWRLLLRNAADAVLLLRIHQKGHGSGPGRYL
jgi:hypothetical protein